MAKGKKVFTCDDFRRWSLEEDNKKRRPYSRSLARHELTCVPCLEWMMGRMRKALADHATGALLQGPQELASINRIVDIISRRMAGLTEATTESFDPDASAEAEPTLSDLADIETDD